MSRRNGRLKLIERTINGKLKVTTGEAADYLGCMPQTLRKRRSLGLPPEPLEKVGGRCYYLAKTIIEFKKGN